MKAMISRATAVPSAAPTRSTSRTSAAGRPRKPRGRLRRDRVLLLMCVPGILLLAIFHYVPILGNVIAFKRYQPFLGIGDSPWSGLDNFRVIFNGDPAFMNALGNTIVLLILQVVLVFPLPVVLALLLNSVMTEWMKRAVQSILYVPHFMSWVIVVAIFQQMLGGAGLLNAFLRNYDLATVQLIGNPELFRVLLTAEVIWKDTGWGTIIFLAALSSISSDLYEAAACDGAGAWRRTWHVTLPGLRGIIVLLLILRLGDALTVGFEQIILQQQAVGLQASEVLDTYVYNNGVLGGQWGVSAAVGLVKGAVGVLLVLGANKLAHLVGEGGIYRS